MGILRKSVSMLQARKIVSSLFKHFTNVFAESNYKMWRIADKPHASFKTQVPIKDRVECTLTPLPLDPR